MRESAPRQHDWVLTLRFMAWIQERQRPTGTTYAVMYRMGGRGSRQSSMTIVGEGAEADAKRFKALVDALGPQRAWPICLRAHQTTKPMSDGSARLGTTPG